MAHKGSVGVSKLPSVAAQGSVVGVSMGVPFREAVKRAERAFLKEGFELSQRVAISDLLKSRLGVDTPRAELLFLYHPVLAFQVLLAGNDAFNLFPLVITVSASSRDSSRVILRSALWEEIEPGDELMRCVAEQARARLTRAITRLSESEER